jgi:glyoxylase-like metal-dependent hydrolase (beta-lactamase superfamily II)
MQTRAVAALLIAAWSADANAQAALDRAVQALGGADALQKIEVVRLQLEGETWSRLQTRTPEPPFEAGKIELSLLLDLKQDRLLFRQHEIETGFVRDNTTLIKGERAGTIYNHRSETVRSFPSPPSIPQQFAPHYRRLPHLLLRQALDRRDTVRSLGPATFEGKPQDVFTFVTPDEQQVAVYVDATSALVTKYETRIDDPLAGDAASEVIFEDYARVGATQVPRSLRLQEAGQLTQRSKLDIAIDPAVTDRSFEVTAAKNYTRVAPSPDSLPERVEQLADGVFVLHNVSAASQNTLAVEFKDYIVAVEAPGSSSGADKVIARIKATIPDKPIRYVAVTHHHGDHIGGLRSFIAEGATVITTAGTRKIVEQLMAAPHVDRLAAQPRPPEFLMLEKGRRVLTDGSRTVELIDIGPHPHASEMVIAYLPNERVVFQGDMFIIPRNEASSGPPAPTTVSFAKKLEELRLNVDRIGSVHGRSSTIEELRKRLKD